MRIALINKGSEATDVTLSGVTGKLARMWRLQGPALDATEGVTLGSAEIAAKWKPRDEDAAVSGDAVRVKVPGASGLVLFVS